MPEEAQAAPADEQVTPDTAAPENEGTPATESEATATDTPDDIDWKDRYENLRPDHTRATQAVSQYEQLLTRAREGDTEALDALEIPYEAEEEDEFDDPWDKLESRLAKLEEAQTEGSRAAEQAKLDQMEEEFIETQLDELEDELNFKLTEEDEASIVAAAVNDRAENGEPNIKGAFKAYVKSVEAAAERYLKSKQEAAKAPVGGPGEEKIDLSDDDARQKHMAQIVEAEGSD